MAGRLEGKVAVVTGGASGIGAATVELFVAEGARVVIGDLQGEVGEEVAGSLGERASFLPCDVSKEDQVKALVDEAVSRFGRLDCIYNNAGFGGAIGPVESITEDDFDLTFDVLLKGVFFGMKHAAPVLKAQGSGSIISTASMAGLRTGIGAHLYNVAKAAVIHLTSSVANELAEQSIRVNCVCPGFVGTPLAAGKPISYSGREAAEARVEKMRQWGDDA
ncbi:MAG: SDR family oxidoreductase, partial [Acidimicrobiia bacterium]|nr:SDR family oxidoreductase [Acidimicrobiia bacterium]